MKCCSKYSGCLKQIENRQQSGINETDKVLQTKSLYYENEKKHFSLDHCWAILEHAIKWEDRGSSKKPKSPPMTPYSFSPFSSPHPKFLRRPSLLIPIKIEPKNLLTTQQPKGLVEGKLQKKHVKKTR